MTTIYRIVLGASDPEMAAISKLGAALKLRVTQATVNGRPVRPGELADSPAPLEGDLWVECAPRRVAVFCAACGNGAFELGQCCQCGAPAPDGEAGDGGSILAPIPAIVRADHHAPGDPGHGRPPAEFLAASSIGQVVAALAAQGDLPGDWEQAPYYGDAGEVGNYHFPVDGSWWVVAQDPPSWWSWDLDSDGPDHSRVRIPQEIVMTAAADHCLQASYAGQCPGVDPVALMRWRAESRAAFQGRPVEDVLRDVEETTTALRQAPRLWLPDCPPKVSGACPRQEYDLGGHPECGGCAVLLAAPTSFRDMRRDTPWPELPEAAARLGVSYLAGPITEKDGREKLVFSGTPEQVRAFMRDARRGEVAGAAVDFDSVYGDPARGFAGAYLADSRDDGEDR